MACATPRRRYARGVDDDDALGQDETQLTQCLERVDLQVVDVGNENVGSEPT